MIERLTHPRHGVKYVYHDNELIADLKAGWVREDEAQVEAPEITTDPEVIDEETIELYVLKFGKKPHHRMKLETILAELNAHSE